MEAMQILKRGGAVVAAAALAGCLGSSDEGGNGSLTLLLTDAPVHDVAQLWVEFDGVTLHREGGPPIEILFESAIQVDLLTLTPDNAAELLKEEPIPAGSYTQIALHVNAQHDGVYDSYAVLNGGGQVELFVPSGAQTGLKVINSFTITANQETSFLIDWDARMGLVINPPGLPGYILRPTLRIIDLTEYGTLAGTVAMPLVLDASCSNDLNLDTGNAVYVYDSFDVGTESPGDMGGAGHTPVATATVSQQANGEYAFSTILSPGEYVVAFTCQASDDDPEEADDIALLGAAAVEIQHGTETEVHFD